MEKRRTIDDKQKKKHIDDDTQDITPQGWHRLYVSKKKEEDSSVEACVDVTIQGHEEYTKKDMERLIIAGNDCNELRKNRKTANNKNKKKSEEKQLYGYFKTETMGIAYYISWTCLRRGHRKRETESLLKQHKMIL